MIASAPWCVQCGGPALLLDLPDRPLPLPIGSAAAADPQRMRVYRRVLGAIREGVLQPGTRLLSARQLAQQWGVARGAVDAAFAQLQQEGLIERRVGNGSFVVDRLPPGTRLEASAAAPQPSAATAPQLLNPLLIDTDSFPLAAWRRQVARSLRDADRAGLSWGAPAGLASLRQATARNLRLTRAIDCTPQQVIIVNSALHALELIVHVLLEPGDRIGVEDPGFPVALRVFTQANIAVVPVPVDDAGFDVEAAGRLAPDAAALVLHPLNQYPLGQRTSAARRRALLEMANASGAWVIEGEHMAEVVHDGAAPPALWRSDRAERVLYVGTFNDVTFPSLRLAYLIVPERLAPVFAAVRGMMGDHAAVAPQQALAGFIEEGHLATHVRALRSLYGRRREAFLQSVERHLGSLVRLGPTSAGTHACLHLDPVLADGPLAATLAAQDLQARSLSALCRQPRGLNGLVVGYGGQDEARTDHALARVAELLAGAATRPEGRRPW